MAGALLMLQRFMAAAGGIRLWPVIFKTGYNTNASDNDYIFTAKSPQGNIGKVYEHFIPGSGDG